MNSENGKFTREAALAGASSGTVLASLFSLLEDGTFRSALLILAPAMAVVVAAIWGLVVSLVSDQVADWKIGSQLKKAEKILAGLRSDRNTSAETIQSAEEQVEALKLLEIQLSQKRIEAVMDTAA